jgi:hypothetical protein
MPAVASSWVGPPNPDRRVRIAYLRTKRILMYLRLQPGMVMARARADEVLLNEAGTELVVVNYLD